MALTREQQHRAGILLQNELEFHRDGWSTILVNPGLKTPLGRWASSQLKRRSEEQIIKDRRAHPLANIGLVCGPISGRTVIDLDGEEGKATFEAQLDHLPATRTHQTPSGGYHKVYTYSPDFHTGANFLPKVDVRNDGGYIVGPGSIVNDIEYRVVDNRPPATIEITPVCFLPKEEAPAAPRAAYTGEIPEDMPSMLQMIAQVNPRTIHNNADPRWRYQMACPLPTHQNDWDGDGGSFYIDAEERFYKCFGCDTGPGSPGRGNPLSLYRRLYGEPFRPARTNLDAPDPMPWQPLDEDCPWEQEELSPQADPDQPRSQERKQMMYAARKHNLRLAYQNNTHDLFTTSQPGVGKEVMLLTENSNLYLSKERLLSIFNELNEPKLSEKYGEKVESCGYEGAWLCATHGERQRGRKTCKFSFHPSCCSDTTNRLVQLDLADLEGESHYREVWLESSFFLPGDDWWEWADVLKWEIQEWKNAVAKVGRRAQWKGRILHRSHAMYLGDPVSIHWKIMVREHRPGEADEIIQDLYDEMRCHDRREKFYQQGDTAIVQLMENSTMTLVGIEEGAAEAAYFYAYWLTSKGRHGFQSMGVIFSGVRETTSSKPVIPTCDVCGEQLTFRLLTAQELRGTPPPPPEPVPVRPKPPPRLRERQLVLV